MGCLSVFHIKIAGDCRGKRSRAFLGRLGRKLCSRPTKIGNHQGLPENLK